MNTLLAGKSALINGGAGGLGAASARRLAELGAGVVIFDLDGDRAGALAEEIGANAVAIAGGQSDDAVVAAAIAAAKELGEFTINVNAAGSQIRTPSMVTNDGSPHDLELFKSMFEMHVFGPFNVSRLSAASFAQNTPDVDAQRGIIINTASVSAYDGQRGQVAYAGSKAAIAAMALTMSRELAHLGIRSNAIAPGPIWTPRLSSAPKEIHDRLLEHVAFPKRFGKAEEYATLVEAMVRTPFLNGQTIRLDGGTSTGLSSLASDS